jgi:hypothetical protein
MDRKSKGAVVALSVATLFSAGAEDAQVKCMGVNECAVKGGCASAHNECGGKNKCKGMGVVQMSADECKQKGGKVAE